MNGEIYDVRGFNIVTVLSSLFYKLNTISLNSTRIYYINGLNDPKFCMKKQRN